MSIVCRLGRAYKAPKTLFYYKYNVNAMFKCDLVLYQNRPNTLLIIVNTHLNEILLTYSVDINTNYTCRCAIEHKIILSTLQF